MCTNIEYYEHGDFLMTNSRIAFIFDRKGKNGEAHYLFCVDIDRPINNILQKCGIGERYCGYLETAFLADNEATEAIIKGLKKLGKYWNENKKRIENIGIYKEGDFLKTFRNNLFILKKIDMFEVYDHVFLTDNSLIPGESRCCYIEDIAGYCTPKEEIKIINALKKAGKRWNAKTKRIETIPTYKNGDFLRTKLGNLFILKEIKRVYYEKELSAFCHFFTSVSSDYKGYGLNKNGVCFEKDIDRYCTPEEKQKILDDLAKDGKYWNTEKKCVEGIPVYKDGDFLHSDWRNENITIIYRKRSGNQLYYHVGKSNCIGLCFNKESFWNDDVNFRLATESEKKELIDALTGAGKCWNIEKKCIEDIPVYKDGDFVVSELGSILIFKEADGDRIFDHACLTDCDELLIDIFGSYDGVKRYATTEEKQRIIEALAERGKRWNYDKKCIEDIPKRKFKAGDKVKIKDGISSKTHRNINPNFTSTMDKFIGKELTVKKYSRFRQVEFCEDDYGYQFNEDWLELWDDKSDCIFKKGDRVIFSKDFSERMRNENGHFANNVKKYIGKPLTVSKVCNNVCVWIEGEELHGFSKDCLELWIDEPKVGDWVIFWDYNPKLAKVGILTGVKLSTPFKYKIDGETHWLHAVKWNGTKEHIEKIQKE